jgi:hypothetical protein
MKMSINDLNEILADIRSAREDKNELRVLQLLASITPDRRAEVAPFAGVAPEAVETIHFAADFLARFDEDGDVTDDYWLIRDAADLATVDAWSPIVARIMRETLAALPKWEKATEGAAFLWCTGVADLQHGTPGGIAAVVLEGSDKARWVEALDEDADAEDGVDYDQIYKTCWDADQYGTKIYVMPSADGAGWEVWSCWA